MKHFKSLSVNRWLTGFLSLTLLVSILTSSSGLLLRGAFAQRKSSSKAGSKFAADLPDLARVRYKTTTQPKAPDFAGSSSTCFDCKKSEVFDDAFSQARLDPSNRTGQSGVDLLSQNAHWSQSLINLKGRAGLDLDLSLSYNSLVWTKAGPQIAFDLDRGQPAPGFRLGFPTIQPRYRDTVSGKLTFLMISPEGKHIELRQSGQQNIYESVDNSLLQMVDHGASGAVLLRPDGTRLSFEWYNGQLQCVEARDRNGNYISSDYDKRGHLNSITDTIGRTLLFTRDQGGNLVSIKQKTNGPDQRVLTTFDYSNLVLQTNFTGLKIVGMSNDSTITVLTRVGLRDGSYYEFDYTSWGQVWKITKHAPDGHALNYLSYSLPQDGTIALDRTPRPTEMRSWAEGANNDIAAVTSYVIDPNGSSGQVTLPDGSSHKEIFATEGWQRGLTTEAEDSANGNLQRRTVTEWTQDDQSLKYGQNPRAREIHIYYANGITQRTRMEYAANGLVGDLYRYSSNEITPVQHTHIEYVSDPVYEDRHVLGIVKEETNYDTDGSLMSKTNFTYDANSVEEASAVQHDNRRYGADLQKGRGLLSSVTVWNRNTGQSMEIDTRYNTTGSVVFKRESDGRETHFDYTDNFADGRNHGAFAFVTARTDSKNNRLSTQYVYESGAKVRTQDEHGTIKVFSYDSADRPIGSTNQTTGGSARRIYDDSGTLVATFTKLRANLKELGSYVVLDGAGRLRARAKDPLTKVGGYKGSYIKRDIMGRPVSQTKATKMTSAWELIESPIVLNSTEANERKEPQSLAATAAQFGNKLVAGLNEVINAAAPTASAQTDCNYYYCADDGIGTWTSGSDGYDYYVGDYDGAYSPDLGATWNASGQFWDFGGDQTPIQISDASDSSVGDQLMIAGGLVLVFGGPEDPVGDIAAGGYLTYEWLIVGSAVVAAGSSGGIAQTAFPPVPWADPSVSPGAGWEWRGPGAPGSEQGAWHNPGTGESLHPDMNHPGPVGPHWDYVDPNGQGWRVYPDGRMEPK